MKRRVSLEYSKDEVDNSECCSFEPLSRRGILSVPQQRHPVLCMLAAIGYGSAQNALWQRPLRHKSLTTQVLC